MAIHVCTSVAQLNTALATAVAGDTIQIRAGYYQTTNAGTPSNQRNDGGFHFANSGTLGNPITLTRYPGDAAPILANRPNGSSAYFNFPTITFPRNYIVIDWIRVDGAIYSFCDTYSVVGTTLVNGRTGNVIKNCEVWEGWETTGDGNWCGIRVEGQVATLENNYVHDMNQFGNNANPSSQCGIKVFSGVGSTGRYNTIKNCLNGSQAPYIDDKADSINNTWCYNWGENLSNGNRIQQQSSPGGTADPATGTRWFQNITIIGNVNGRGFTQEEGPIDDYSYFNNLTVIDVAPETPGSDDGMLYAANSGSGQAGGQFYNNINYIPTSFRGVSSYAPTFTAAGFCNYNHYSKTTCPFRHSATNYPNFAAWQAAPFDANGTSGDPLFVNAAGRNFHLQPSSPCKNAGRVGGTGAGAVIDQGPYVNGIRAIGHGAVAPTGLAVS